VRRWSRRARTSQPGLTAKPIGKRRAGKIPYTPYTPSGKVQSIMVKVKKHSSVWPDFRVPVDGRDRTIDASSSLLTEEREFTPSRWPQYPGAVERHSRRVISLHFISSYQGLLLLHRLTAAMAALRLPTIIGNLAAALSGRLPRNEKDPSLRYQCKTQDQIS